MPSSRPDRPGDLVIQFLMELKRGDIAEPPVSNLEQIEAFARYGVWLRPLAAHRLISSHDVGDEISPTFVANVVGAYQQIGMFYEDIIATSAAWGAIKKQPDLLIANLLEKIFITKQKEKTDSGILYHEDVFENLASSEKRVHIDPVQYAKSLLSIDATRALNAFGIGWKPHRSKKFYTDKHIEWAKLPLTINLIFNQFSSPESELVKAIHNKIKHGPQITVANPVGKLRERGDKFTQDDDRYVRHAVVRVMLKGARTQQTPEEADNETPVAPFIVGDPATLRKWVNFHAIGPAMLMQQLAGWIYRELSGKPLSDADDANVKSLKENFNRYMFNPY